MSCGTEIVRHGAPHPEVTPEYTTRQITVEGEPLELQGASTAIIAGLLPACEDCRPRLDEQAYVLTSFVELGRLTTQKAIDVLNERPCVHIELGELLDIIAEPSSLVTPFAR